jgi:hypothetical protein
VVGAFGVGLITLNFIQGYARLTLSGLLVFKLIMFERTAS